MTISSDEARRLQFSGTEHSYDGREVEAFRKRVVAALEAAEAATGDVAEPSDSSAPDVASAQRIRHQAVGLAERMLRDVMGASDDGTGGFSVWQDAAMLRALAEEELEFANEEARRLPATAAAERDEIRADYADELKDMRKALHTELQASRDAALAGADEIKARSVGEAEEIVKKAVERAEQSQRTAQDEVNRLQRRITVLHTALADAESRFRRLAATAANEIGTLASIADQDVDSAPASSPVAERPDLRLAAVDLRDDSVEIETGETKAEATEPSEPEVDPEAGFYQKRLAGLRDRLEKSGHPPS